jgi:hypothetical protein
VFSASQARDALAARVEHSNGDRLGRDRPSFEGEISIESLRLRRVINNRNSFLPQIRGRIIATTSGSIVEGTMRLHPVVLGFMIIWFALLFDFSSSAWIDMVSQRVWQPGALVSLVMFVFAWTLMSVAFTVEANKAKASLVEILASPDQRSTISSDVAY